MTTQETSPLFLLTAVGGEQRLLVDRPLTMGRDPASDVVLDQGGASRRHAQLTPDAEGVWVEDSGSTNGTLVNGERIEQARLLKEGDQLQVGQATYKLEVKAPVAESDPEATQLYSADPDATALFSSEGDSSGTRDEASHAEQEPQEPTPAGDDPEAPDSKPPPSWVLNNQQSVNGTAFFSKDVLQESLRNSESSGVPQEAVSEPTLIGNNDPVVGIRFQLIGDDKNQWEIGRSPDADVMVNDQSVSGSHAQIIHENGRWKVVDLMSANGTYANGKKCLSGYLSSGDTVCFGSVECTFMLPEEQPQSQGRGKTTARVSSSRSDIKTAAIAFVVTAVVAGIALFFVGRSL